MARKGSTRAAAFAMVSITVGVAACARAPSAAPSGSPLPGVGSSVPAAALSSTAGPADAAPSGEATTPTGGLSGDVRVIPRADADTTLGPIVITAEPVSSVRRTTPTPRRIVVASATDRFEPAFTTLSAGDSVVFVNEGKLSHRLFSADLEADLQIPVRPESSSEPVAIDHRGGARFFCSLHPDESFDLLVTAPAPWSTIDHNGWYDIWPLEDGFYRLSIWTRRVSGPVRVVEVAAGHLSIETIWIDPELIGK